MCCCIVQREVTHMPSFELRDWWLSARYSRKIKKNSRLTSSSGRLSSPPSPLSSSPSFSRWCARLDGWFLGRLPEISEGTVRGQHPQPPTPKPPHLFFYPGHGEGPCRCQSPLSRRSSRLNHHLHNSNRGENSEAEMISGLLLLDWVSHCITQNQLWP